MYNIKIFQTSSTPDWFAATCLQEAIQCVKDTYGASDLEEFVDDAYQVPDADLDKLVYIESEDVKRTFREQLNKMLTDGSRFPCLFASTEY